MSTTLSYPLTASPEAQPDYAAINAAFQAMPPAEKRRAIARDILGRLALGQLIPTPSRWVRVPSLVSRLDLYEGADLRDTAFAGLQCECCAIGAAIIGLACMQDAIKVIKTPDWNMPDGVDSVGTGLSVTKDRLTEIFTSDQLYLMERAFERGGSVTDTAYEWSAPDDQREASDAIYAACSGPAQRLSVVWQSIADHPEGLFDPIAVLAVLKAATPISPEAL